MITMRMHGKLLKTTTTTMTTTTTTTTTTWTNHDSDGTPNRFVVAASSLLTFMLDVDGARITPGFSRDTKLNTRDLRASLTQSSGATYSCLHTCLH